MNVPIEIYEIIAADTQDLQSFIAMSCSCKNAAVAFVKRKNYLTNKYGNIAIYFLSKNGLFVHIFKITPDEFYKTKILSDRSKAHYVSFITPEEIKKHMTCY